MKRIKLCQTPDYSDHNTGSSADQRMECSPDRFLTELPGRETAAVSWNQEGEQIHLEISLPYEGVYGLGERFNGLNQKSSLSKRLFGMAPRFTWMKFLFLRLLMEWMNFAYTSLPTPDSPRIITEVVTEASLVAIL